MNKRKKVVLAFGTYDLFHPGHEYFLREAKQLGDCLVVIVARDTNVQKIKGRAPYDLEQDRLAHVVSFPFVDEAMLGYEDFAKHLQVLEDIEPDIICLGYDQQATLPDGPWRVVRLDPYKSDQYKSSLLRPE